jgi:hypothetical protein
LPACGRQEGAQYEIIFHFREAPPVGEELHILRRIGNEKSKIKVDCYRLYDLLPQLRDECFG